MRYIAILLVAITLPQWAFARSYVQPEPHKRFAPSAAYYLDFNPDADRHTVYATQQPDVPLWTVSADSFWPYAHDESDGCLFVANDGSSVAGLTYVHAIGQPADHRVFDGLEFFNRTGRIAAYRISELPVGRVPLLDIPIRMVWFAFHGYDSRGSQLARNADMLEVAPFGMRSFDFSINSGQIAGWRINSRYFGYMALVYSVPVWIIVRWARRGAVLRQVPPASHHPGNPSTLTKTLGTVLVVANSVLFAAGVYMNSFGGAIDRLGGYICSFTYLTAFWLVPATICISLLGLSATPRRFDLIGPWLSVLSALTIVAFINY